MNYDKSLINIKAFLPDDNEIVDIIKICDLEPVDDWTKWSDNLGNTLNIKRNKTAFVSKSSKKHDTIIKDIHFKAPIDVISKNSKWALVSFSESISDKNLKSNGTPNMCFIWFLDKNNKLRLCILIKNEWIENQPPLISGIPLLRAIVKNLDIESHENVELPCLHVPYPAASIKAWATRWPPTNNVVLDMMLTYQPIARRVVQDCKIKEQK